jgi:hypothetical protein
MYGSCFCPYTDTLCRNFKRQDKAEIELILDGKSGVTEKNSDEIDEKDDHVTDKL